MDTTNWIGLFAFTASINLFVWPAFTTFSRIVKKRNTEQFSGVPYVAALLSCLLSAWYYGVMFVSLTNDWGAANAIGLLFETVYVLIFIIFAPKEEKAKIKGLCALVLTIFSVVALVSIYALDGNSSQNFCGVVAAISTILMYASPLSILGTVVKTKSVEFMPDSLSFYMFLSGTFWLVNAILRHDPYVAVPNGFGCALGLLQLILYCCYKMSGDRQQPLGAEDNVELADNGV